MVKAPPDIGQLAFATLEIEDGPELACWFNPKEYTITKASTAKVPTGPASVKIALSS